MRIRTGSSCRDRRTSILGSVSLRLCLLFAPLMLTAFVVPAQAGWDEARAALQRGDYEAAFEEFLPLALAGDAAAQSNLGVMYANGEGVLQDYSRAAEWYRAAAEQGNAIAQYSLGSMYYKGEGVPQDYAEATKWLRRAAEQDSSAAQHGLGWIYYEGHGLPQDYLEAAKWFRRAAEQGEPRAQFMLGFLYGSGHGVPQNLTLAYMWLNLSAASAQPGKARDMAVARRDMAARYLSEVEIARAQRMARNWRPTIETASQPDASAPSGAVTIGRSQSSENTVDTLEELTVWLTQRDLAELGYDPGPVDGIMGPQTRAAIRGFQADVGLPADGRVSEALNAALSEAASGSRTESVEARWSDQASTAPAPASS
jgi:TPR repeat protein